MDSELNNPGWEGFSEPTEEKNVFMWCRYAEYIHTD